uniref:Uncharacterized protein n=1 Tax=Amphimedon queenslandica TaxID=400682 RepID=A0A1X7SNS7_AMPQE
MKLAKLKLLLVVLVLLIAAYWYKDLGQGTREGPSVNSIPASINGEEDQTEKPLPDPLRHGEEDQTEKPLPDPLRHGEEDQTEKPLPDPLRHGEEDQTEKPLPDPLRHGEEDQTEKPLPDPLRHGQYPNNQSDLWIQISKEFIVRRLGYLDKRDRNNVSINLLSMQHKEKGQPPDIFLKIYHKNNHNVSCLSTLSNYSSFNGSDTYVLYWIHSPPLRPELTSSRSISYVTISTNKQCLNESDSILIRTVGDKPPKHNFGICLHKAFENLTPKDLTPK